jgi:hypothetical protein
MIGHHDVRMKLELVEQFAPDERLHYNSSKLVALKPKRPGFSPMEDSVHRDKRSPGGELFLGEPPFTGQTAGEAERQE